MSKSFPPEQKNEQNVQSYCVLITKKEITELSQYWFPVCEILDNYSLDWSAWEGWSKEEEKSDSEKTVIANFSFKIFYWLSLILTSGSVISSETNQNRIGGSQTHTRSNMS